MPIPPVALKRRNHRLLLCENARKNDLLAKLIAEHEGKRIAVAVSDDAAAIPVPEGITVLSDAALPETGAAYDLLISYDLPEDPARYLSRLALTEGTALALLGESDRAHLLGIETLLGRAVSQERPEGFAPPPPAKPKTQTKHAARNGKNPSRDRQPQNAPFKTEAKPAAKRKPKASGVSRYIGKDENGKPMFSGKTGERNHRFDGKPHTEESLAAKNEWDEKRKKSGGKKPYASKGKSEAPARDKKTESVKPKRPMIRIKAEKLNPKTPKK